MLQSSARDTGLGRSFLRAQCHRRVVRSQGHARVDAVVPLAKEKPRASPTLFAAAERRFSLALQTPLFVLSSQVPSIAKEFTLA